MQINVSVHEWAEMVERSEDGPFLSTAVLLLVSVRERKRRLKKTFYITFQPFNVLL